MTQKKLPKDWKKKTLGDILKISSGSGLSKSKRNDEGEFLVYGGNGITGKHNEYLFEQERLIIGRVGVHCGNAYITKPKSWVTDNAFVVSFNEAEINKKFLLNLIGVLNLNKYSVSTAQPVISQGTIYPIEISLPPFETQTLIVSKIEELFSELDKGIEDLKNAQQQLKTYRQSVLRYAFEGKLTNKKVKDGELPKGWEWTTFGAACERIFDGTHFSPKNYPTGKYKYITAKNIKEKGIDLTKISYVSEEDHRGIYSRSDVKKDDVLYIKDGATTGIACINNFDEEFSLLSSVGVFRTNPAKVNSKFLCYFLNSQVTRNKMLSNIAGVAITRLTLIKLKNSDFVIAPIEEQHQIVQEIESRLSVADKMEESIVQSLLQAEALRQSILKKALSGELV